VTDLALHPAGDVVTPATAGAALAQVVAAALVRTALLARAAATATAAAVGLLVAGDRSRTLVLLAVLAVTTAAQVAALGRRPALVRARIAVLATDAVLLLVVLALSQGGLAYFTYGAGSAALAGVLLGTAAAPLWAAQTVQGFVVAAVVLRATQPPATVAPFVLAAPMAGVLTGVGAALATRALTAQLHRSVALIATAQRAAAAQERARLARELHDSVAKTLRAVSLAAVALPGSLRRQPALAEQLAGAVSAGAHAASREARDLIDGLRLDVPHEPFRDTLAGILRAWTGRTGVPAHARIDPAEPSLPVRYELARIAHEALANVERHAGATYVEVDLTERDGTLTLAVRDDGRGFTVPRDLTALLHDGHAGLVGMAERARVAGGALAVTSTPGAGTEVRVRVPS